MVGRDKFLNGPARYRLEGILMGILVSGDLVVKFANLVVKMEHLVVILSDLVVKNTGLVVIVLFRSSSEGCHKQKRLLAEPKVVIGIYKKRRRRYNLRRLSSI